MSSQRISPTSSISSRSGSPDTRATTPSSTLDCSSLSPSNYVSIHRKDLNPEGLKAVYAKYAVCDALGLIIEQEAIEPTVVCPDAQWDTESLQLGADATVEFSVSSSYDYKRSHYHCEPVLSIDNDQAAYHRIFSESSLRSTFSLSLTPHTTLHVLENSAFVYPPLSSTIASSLAPSADLMSGNIPTLNDWKTLWATWDLITREMIPDSMLHQKPIDLRHKCLFYIGHIPTFLDMLLCKSILPSSIKGLPTEPVNFRNIFERGIDPHVDDPDHCHNHSEVPENDEDWPCIDEILSFRDGVRSRLEGLYDAIAADKSILTRNVARTLVMTYEHEGFHVETLLYMLIQRAGTGTIPPPGFSLPPWEELSQQWAATPPTSMPLPILGPATITLGHDDSEADDKVLADKVQGHTFGWDNESPRRCVQVGAFKAEWRPVSNGEFKAFLDGAGADKVDFPKSWVTTNEELQVRTLYGLVPFHVAEHWPVLTSYDDLAIYAAHKGGRLPTEPELRLFLDVYEVGHDGGANVGFRNWHPVPATTGLEKYRGRGSNGGVWEWTSTQFDTHDGLVPTQLFTGYSVDFFDTKHHIALGASYATIPRLASRRTVRNFYQHNYPYPWIGARVVYDV